MKNSKNSLRTLTDELVQLPLKGFNAELESHRDGWKQHITGLGEGRFKITSTKIKK